MGRCRERQQHLLLLENNPLRSTRVCEGFVRERFTLLAPSKRRFVPRPIHGRDGRLKINGRGVIKPHEGLPGLMHSRASMISE